MKNIILFLILFCISFLGKSTNYYVATSGDNGNSGDLTHPWATLYYAATVAIAGDTVIVEDGTYYATAGGLFANFSTSGNISAYITYKARNIGGAILDGQNGYSLRGFNVTGNYINIEGFEMLGTSERFFVISGSYINIRNIHGHHNCGICSDSSDSYSFASVTSTANTILFERCLIHDIGRLGPGESGCSPETDNYKEHDHGIYSSGATNLTVQNCIFYNIHHGFALQVYSGAGATSTNVKFINNTCESGNPYHPAGHVIFWGSTNGALIANNIFKDHYQYGIQVYQGEYTYSDVLITKNIVKGGNNTMVTGSATGVTVSNNYENSDPLFTDETNHVYTLQANSPAINVGYDTGVTTDYLGKTRVSPIDLGAYEYINWGNIISSNGKIIVVHGKLISQ